VPPIDPVRGEVWRVDLDPTRGAEMRKVRPVIVVSGADVGRLPLRLVVPLTGWSDAFNNFPWMSRLEPSAASGLTKPSGADAFQMRGVDLSRFQNRLGVLELEVVQAVARTIALVVEYEPAPATDAAQEQGP
jgi:mRNA interferase MazF